MRHGEPKVFSDKAVGLGPLLLVQARDPARSHIRMALTRTSETIPVSNGKMLLGTWQGIYLFEHRRAPHTRQVIATAMGTA
jgi:secondary thiamine-phosphate synthase enzyme